MPKTKSQISAAEAVRTKAARKEAAAAKRAAARVRAEARRAAEEEAAKIAAEEEAAKIAARRARKPRVKRKNQSPSLFRLALLGAVAASAKLSGVGNEYVPTSDAGDKDDSLGGDPYKALRGKPTLYGDDDGVYGAEAFYDLTSTPSPSAYLTPSSLPEEFVSQLPPHIVPALRRLGASESPSSSSSASSSVSASITITPSFSASPSVSPSVTLSQTLTSSPTKTEFYTESATVSPTGTPTGTSSTSVTITHTPSTSPSESPTITGSVTVTNSVSNSVTPSSSATPSTTSSPSETPSSSATTTSTVTTTGSYSATGTLTSSVSESQSRTVSSSGSVTSSDSSSTTATYSQSSSGTATLSSSITKSESQTVTPTESTSVSATTTNTYSPSPSPSETPTLTSSKTKSESQTVSPTGSVTSSTSVSASTSNTYSASPSGTPTLSSSTTESESQTVTPTESTSVSTSATNTFSASASGTPTLTSSKTESESQTLSLTGSVTSSASSTTTATYSSSESGTPTLTSSETVSASTTYSPTSSSSVSETSTSTTTTTPTQSVTKSESTSFSDSGSPTSSTSATTTTSLSPSTSPSVTPTPTSSTTVSATQIFSPSPSLSATPTVTAIASATATTSYSPSGSVSQTVIRSNTRSVSPSASVSPSISDLVSSLTGSSSPSLSPSPSSSLSQSVTITPTQIIIIETSTPSPSSSGTPSPTTTTSTVVEIPPRSGIDIAKIATIAGVVTAITALAVAAALNRKKIVAKCTRLTKARGRVGRAQGGLEMSATTTSGAEVVVGVGISGATTKQQRADERKQQRQAEKDRKKQENEDKKRKEEEDKKTPEQKSAEAQQRVLRAITGVANMDPKLMTAYGAHGKRGGLTPQRMAPVDPDAEAVAQPDDGRRPALTVKRLPPPPPKEGLTPRRMPSTNPDDGASEGDVGVGTGVGDNDNSAKEYLPGAEGSAADSTVDVDSVIRPTPASDDPRDAMRRRIFVASGFGRRGRSGLATRPKPLSAAAQMKLKLPGEVDKKSGVTGHSNPLFIPKVLLDAPGPLSSSAATSEESMQRLWNQYRKGDKKTAVTNRGRIIPGGASNLRLDVEKRQTSTPSEKPTSLWKRLWERLSGSKKVVEAAPDKDGVFAFSRTEVARRAKEVGGEDTKSVSSNDPIANLLAPIFNTRLSKDKDLLKVQMRQRELRKNKVVAYIQKKEGLTEDEAKTKVKKAWKKLEEGRRKYIKKEGGASGAVASISAVVEDLHDDAPDEGEGAGEWVTVERGRKKGSTTKASPDSSGRSSPEVPATEGEVLPVAVTGSAPQPLQRVVRIPGGISEKQKLQEEAKKAKQTAYGRKAVSKKKAGNFFGEPVPDLEDVISGAKAVKMLGEGATAAASNPGDKAVQTTNPLIGGRLLTTKAPKAFEAPKGSPAAPSLLFAKGAGTVMGGGTKGPGAAGRGLVPIPDGHFAGASESGVVAAPRSVSTSSPLVAALVGTREGQKRQVATADSSSELVLGGSAGAAADATSEVGADKAATMFSRRPSQAALKYAAAALGASAQKPTGSEPSKAPKTKPGGAAKVEGGVTAVENPMAASSGR